MTLDNFARDAMNEALSRIGGSATHYYARIMVGRRGKEDTDVFVRLRDKTTHAPVEEHEYKVTLGDFANDIRREVTVERLQQWFMQHPGRDIMMAAGYAHEGHDRAGRIIPRLRRH